MTLIGVQETSRRKRCAFRANNVGRVVDVRASPIRGSRLKQRMQVLGVGIWNDRRPPLGVGYDNAMAPLGTNGLPQVATVNGWNERRPALRIGYDNARDNARAPLGTNGLPQVAKWLKRIAQLWE